MGDLCSCIPTLNSCLLHPPLPSSTFNIGWNTGFIHSLICTTSLYPFIAYMNTWTLCKKSHVDYGPLSGHNGTTATRSELLFLWWHCCYWLTQLCLWKSLKLVVWGNCSLTKKKIARLVFYLAKLWGEDNVGNFCKILKRCTLSELLFGSSLALKLEYCPTLERDPAWLSKPQKKLFLYVKKWYNAHFLRQAQGLICAKSRDNAGCSDLLWWHCIT